MRASLTFAGVLLVAAFAAPAAHAQCYVPYIPKAPDACGPGNFGTNYNGLYYGPNYCVFPPFPPYNGMLPGPCAPAAGAPGVGYGSLPGVNGPVTFPTHPYARGPRDYFMVY